MSPLTRRLLRSARLATPALLAAVGLGVTASALAVAQAWLLSRCIAGAVEERLGVEDLAMPIAAFGVVLIGRAGLAWATELVAHWLSAGVKAALRVGLLERAVALGPRWAADQPSAEVTLLATRGLDALDGYFGRYLPQLVLAAIVPLAVVSCLVAVDVVAALTVALTVPLIPVFMILIGRFSDAHRRRRWRALARLAHRFTDVVEGLPTLRAHGQAEAQVGILRTITDTYRTTTLATLRISFLSALVLELLATISVALVAVGVGLRLAAGGLSLQVGLFALVLAPEAYLPLRRLGAEFHASQEGLAAAGTALAIVDARVPDPAVGVAPPTVIEALVVDGLSVSQPGRDVLAPHDATLSVSRGEVVAVTGPSGSGKSTLIAAVLGLVAPSSGRVALRDAAGTEIDVTTLAPGAWRNRVAWVPQMPWLFAGTIAENVRLGAAGATDAAVAVALADAGLDDLAASSVVRERGAGLSSGQRRRVGIARALVRQAPILLLDEPTAGLDEAAEEHVLAAVRRAAERGAIVLMAAHRPQAVAAADRTVEIRWAVAGPGGSGHTTDAANQSLESGSQMPERAGEARPAPPAADPCDEPVLLAQSVVPEVPAA